MAVLPSPDRSDRHNHEMQTIDPARGERGSRGCAGRLPRNFRTFRLRPDGSLFRH
jgi:hypothetical protein